VATVSEVMMEHRRVDELREKVKYMLQKEVSLAKAISDAQSMADTFEHTKNEIGGIKYMATYTALYFARKVKRLIY
jgi:cell division septum initiation protein DivIVA